MPWTPCIGARLEAKVYLEVGGSGPYLGRLVLSLLSRCDFESHDSCENCMSWVLQEITQIHDCAERISADVECVTQRYQCCKLTHMEGYQT
jgi:hypothetical protein